jgi:hypothetical protein
VRCKLISQATHAIDRAHGCTVRAATRTRGVDLVMPPPY